MTSRNYPRLDIETFGEHLILSGDLDPVYIALSRVEWPEGQLERWLVAYWCLYHPGAASWLSERSGPAFWDALMDAAANIDRKPAPVGGRWPRASERRHWRGANAVGCVEDLRRRYPERPEAMVEYISQPNQPHGELYPQPPSYGLVTGRVMEHVSFGPWIAFKVADMLERVCDVPVKFSVDDAMYESPRQAALELWRLKAGVAADCKIKDEQQAVLQVVDYLIDRFKGHAAPPGGGRPVGYQEVETILCKWKSHKSGHYPLDNDLREIRAGSLPWAQVSSACAEFLHHMPLPGQLSSRDG